MLPRLLFSYEGDISIHNIVVYGATAPKRIDVLLLEIVEFIA